MVLVCAQTLDVILMAPVVQGIRYHDCWFGKLIHHTIVIRYRPYCNGIRLRGFLLYKDRDSIGDHSYYNKPTRKTEHKLTCMEFLSDVVNYTPHIFKVWCGCSLLYITDSPPLDAYPHRARMGIYWLSG